MKAVTFNFSIPRYLAARLLGRRFPSVYTGPASVLALQEVAEPSLRGPDWLLVRPILAGICGTDMGAVTMKLSTALEPFNSFPSVMGHEVVAEVEAVGDAVQHVKPGDRVVVDPYISCEVRGLSPCPSCRQGRTSLCESVGGEGLAPGIVLGFCRDLSGSWAERMAVHRSKAFRVPDALSDEEAVLVEPVSIGVHAALRRPPQSGERVLVIGGGSIGLSMVAALRLLEVESEVTAAVRHPFQEQLARDLGSSHVYRGRDAVFRAATDVTGARCHRPTIGPPVFTGGFDVIFDCVGTRTSLGDALRVARPGGIVVLVGCAGEIPKVDWTFVWSRELEIVGSHGHAIESWEGERRHTFEVTMERWVQMRDLPLHRLITHRYDLGDYREAIRTNVARRKSEAVKTILRCR